MIDSNVPMPSEDATPLAPKKRGRQAKPKVEKQPAKLNPAASLIAALKFVKPVQSMHGEIQSMHCVIAGNWLAASNGVITIAIPVQENWNCCPHTLDLLEALQNCTEQLDVSVFNASNKLELKSANFKASIASVPFAELTIPAPDPNIAVINDNVKFAIDAVMPLATDGATTALYACVCLQAGSAVATNGAGLIEAWHGLDLPPSLMLPKAAATILARSGKPLTGFGYSGSSATFYYEDGSFVKTQLFAEKFPEYQQIFTRAKELWPVKKEFMQAVKAIAAFSRNGRIYMDKGVISSRELENEATTFKIEGLPDGMAFNAKLLMQMGHCIQNIAFIKETQECFMSAPNVRAVLRGLNLEKEKSPTKPVDIDDNDIPF